MRKKILAVLLIVVILLAITTGCGEVKEDLTGKWVKDTEVIELYSDGTGIVTSIDENGNEEHSYSCTWVAENGRLKITYDLGMLGIISKAADYQLSDSSTLICTFDDDGTTEEYHRE